MSPVKRGPCSWAQRARTLVLAAWFAAFIPAADGLAQTQSASPHSVMAAYLYKFPAYVQWPDGHFPAPDTPLTIGVLGMDALAEELAVITAGRRVGARAIRVRRIGAEEELGRLDVLFVSWGARGQLNRIVTAAEGQSLLIVTDAPDAPPPAGSIINFRIVDGRVRFDIELRQAERHGLRLGSALLSVAARVYGAAR